MSEDVKLAIVKSEDLEDWWLIERAEHDGRQWLERTAPGCMELRCSSRLGNADIEGHGAEMLAIADAILAGTSTEFRRCAAIRHDDGYDFLSPRNSREESVVRVTHGRATELARAILDAVRAERIE